MVTSRLPPAALTLKQFLRRQQVLGLYRKILQTARRIPNEADRRYVKEKAREEFKRNKDSTDEGSLVSPGRPGPVRRERSCSPGSHGPGFPKNKAGERNRR
ncbi:LYR motif-containing protein 2-like isoform X1 [Pleurodeles waltl]|uniref:LYR motif-containing protein 2-like isoform X1 n=1 Tax=Pleurodeles waltl TaxID=8319 RepID=UPI0037098653